MFTELDAQEVLAKRVIRTYACLHRIGALAGQILKQLKNSKQEIPQELSDIAEGKLDGSWGGKKSDTLDNKYAESTSYESYESPDSRAGRCTGESGDFLECSRDFKRRLTQRPGRTTTALGESRELLGVYRLIGLSDGFRCLIRLPLAIKCNAATHLACAVWKVVGLSWEASAVAGPAQHYR